MAPKSAPLLQALQLFFYQPCEGWRREGGRGQPTLAQKDHQVFLLLLLHQFLRRHFLLKSRSRERLKIIFSSPRLMQWQRICLQIVFQRRWFWEIQTGAMKILLNLLSYTVTKGYTVCKCCLLSSISSALCCNLPGFPVLLGIWCFFMPGASWWSLPFPASNKKTMCSSL